MQAHNFTLPDQDGREHSLGDYRGQWVILYFYPKDDTPGCTQEACSFRDGYQEVLAANAVVIGISKDTVRSHKKFADKFELPFTLLSDRDRSIIEAYSAWGQKKFMGREYMGILRRTFIIDPEGQIARTYENVTPLAHGQQVLQDLKALQLNDN